MVHKDHVIMFFQCARKSFPAAQCRVNGYLCVFQEFLLDLKVHFIVIDYQNLRLRSRKQMLIFIASDPVTEVGDADIAHHTRIGHSLKNAYRKCRALSVYAVDTDFAAHKVNKLLYYRKSESRTLYIAVLGLIRSLEGIEQSRNDLRFDAYSGIGNGYQQ